VSFTVDIHHHMLPDFFWQATNEGDHPVGGIAPPPWPSPTAPADSGGGGHGIQHESDS